jgi:GxxExxY protein
MDLRAIFSKPVDRTIEGVIKADDAASLRIYKPDLTCFDKIILELKAVKSVLPEHEAQILNYLKATGMKLGLLVNFGSHPKAMVKRLAL